MAEQTPKKSSATAPAQPQAAPAVVWNDSKMHTSYANVCNVLGTREEVMILFGSNQAWQGGQGEVTVRLSERIILSPYAAKRLLQLLKQGLKEYEGRFGELKVPAK